MQKLHVRSLALACGILRGAGILFAGLLSHFFNGFGTEFIASLGSLYQGYDSTWLGILFGTLRAFFDGALAGLILAWLYNLFLPKK